jgi:hypothetical protein
MNFIQYGSNDNINDKINEALLPLLEEELSFINLKKFLFEFKNRGERFYEEEYKKKNDRYSKMTELELNFFIYSNIHQYSDYNIISLFEEYLKSINLLEYLKKLSIQDIFIVKYQTNFIPFK